MDILYVPGTFPAEISSDYTSDEKGEELSKPFQCRCEISERKERTRNFVSKELVNDVIPDENLAVTELIKKRHPNIRSHLLDDAKPRCSLVPYFTG